MRRLPYKKMLLFLGIGVSFSVIWLLIIAVMAENAVQSVKTYGLIALWRIAFLTIANFFIFGYLFPFVQRSRPLQRKIPAAILAGLTVLLLYTWGIYGWEILGRQAGLHFSSRTEGELYKYMISIFMYCLLVFMYFGTVYYYTDFTRLQQKARQLELEKKEAELNYLKSQTNPHFLFNTLNNIYSLARDKSDRTAESVLQLSGILRFMLYETTGKLIPLKDELRIIKDYIALEQLRYDETLTVSLQVNMENPAQEIPPLLLVPLVENAFKHGVSETRENPFVDIHLHATSTTLTMNVKNSTDTIVSPHTPKERIGLSNLRRQLELQYPGHSLNIRQGDGVFTTELFINLSTYAEN